MVTKNCKISQGHVRAFHKTKSDTCHIKNPTFYIKKTIHKNKLFLLKLVLSVYNRNKAGGTCWYRGPFSLIYQYQFTKTCKKKSTNTIRKVKKDARLNA